MNALRVVLLVALAGSALSMGLAVLRSGGATTVPTLRVEVLNACGENGLARRAARQLQELRQDVVGVDTWTGHEFATSFLIDRRGKPALSRRLAERLGPCTVILERTEDARADVSLVLGRDWASLDLFRKVSGPDFAR
ncbi:MAG TPA: LytR C-terminal domain-containing protein [Candidatus Krumholzibacteria bacterium]|nr:LytR C-terminal domain-containing protein [Candidatus Krumholzibacteria bacterium]